MSKLSELIETIRNAAGKATKRPWEFNGDTRIHCGERDEYALLNEIVCEVPDDTYSRKERYEDAKLIVLSANNIEKLALACSVMSKALEWIVNQEEVTRYKAYQALEQVEKILGGG